MNIKPTITALRAAYLGLNVLLLLVAGCATPPEIKTASRAQIELIDAVNDATIALKDGITRFHEDQLARIRQEGRILIARQAISVASADTNATATADGIFKVSNDKVRPWVDYAFSGPEIDAARRVMKVLECPGI